MICERCKSAFIPRAWNHKLCGSLHKKTGCSYLVRKEKNLKNTRIWQSYKKIHNLKQNPSSLKTIPIPSEQEIQPKKYEYWFT
jgi:hypothetical protein